ncbi:hypothetical protein G4G30_07190 [Stenotrophomonas maltophilia]|nr:hypothetical protein G4G30_07190 [Stenotrophomonas maltophilia]
MRLNRRATMTGLSLVELMIALVISLVLMLGWCRSSWPRRLPRACPRGPRACRRTPVSRWISLSATSAWPGTWAA